MDELLAGLLYALSSIVTTFTLAIIVIVLYIGCCGSRGIELGDGVPGAFDDLEQFAEDEQEALEIMDDRSRQSYLMAKRWIDHNPPNSADTDISLSQFMAIQDKAVAAWEFNFDIRQQPSVFVQNRTEIKFKADNTVSCVQTNLPLLKEKALYYWEVKIYHLEPGAKCSVGLTTKPYPLFRLPGMHRYSVAYDSTGHRRLNQPFRAEPYGRQWQRGDVIGVGYRNSNGSVFFTHNGKKLDDVVRGMRLNVFPTVGTTGKASIYVNLGQDGFVFIPANVNDWGLAPVQGSLPPPPAYGSQDDSVLLESTTPVAGPSHLDAPPYQGQEDLHTPPGSPPAEEATAGESAQSQARSQQAMSQIKPPTLDRVQELSEETQVTHDARSVDTPQIPQSTQSQSTQSPSANSQQAQSTQSKPTQPLKTPQTNLLANESSQKARAQPTDSRNQEVNEESQLAKSQSEPPIAVSPNKSHIDDSESNHQQRQEIEEPEPTRLPSALSQPPKVSSIKSVRGESQPAESQHPRAKPLQANPSLSQEQLSQTEVQPTSPLPSSSQPQPPLIQNKRKKKSKKKKAGH